jgi:CRISPR/Cas system-associated exonuclease Cas4 (RecB family)
MTKNLLRQLMDMPAAKPEIINTKALIEKINSGYTAKRIDKHQVKKTFAPSTLVWNHGECARYWYLAFEGNVFESNDTPYGVANMTAGIDSHSRIQKALLDAEIVIPYIDEEQSKKEGKDVFTTEFKVYNDNPPIFGYSDGMLKWEDEEIVLEIKTMNSESFEYSKNNNKPRISHMMQLLIYMKILNKPKGVLIYENKNTHELLVFPVEVGDLYKNWVNNTFDWLKEVRQAWVDKTIPQKNYRSNSKVCKACPVKTACDVADKGIIKIKTMEKLSEIVQ